MSNGAGQLFEAQKNGLIPESRLEQYGAFPYQLDKDQVLFHQGDQALFFHVVRTGCVKMSVYNDKGKEFIQGYFTDGQSFGEPPFFCRTVYPASAIAEEKSVIWRCGYEKFLTLLSDHPDVHLGLTRVLCQRLVYKSMMLSEIAVEEGEHRLKRIIEYFRQSDGVTDLPYRVPFTRQQLADMTGLRVETVIRAIKVMEADGLLQIKRGKIIWMPDKQSG